MDSFLLLRRLVAAIVFKGQTVSDYWWSRRTIFLTLYLSPLSDMSPATSDCLEPYFPGWGVFFYFPIIIACVLTFLGPFISF